MSPLTHTLPVSIAVSIQFQHFCLISTLPSSSPFQPFQRWRSGKQTAESDIYPKWLTDILQWLGSQPGSTAYKKRKWNNTLNIWIELFSSVLKSTATPSHSLPFSSHTCQMRSGWTELRVGLTEWASQPGSFGVVAWSMCCTLSTWLSPC